MSTKTVRKFRIDRKKWLNGNTNAAGSSSLWFKDQQRGCCLGHVARQMTHCSWDELANRPWPSHKIQYKILNKKIGWSEVDKTMFEIASINDNKVSSQQEKEVKLKEKFKALNIEIEFYN